MSVVVNSNFSVLTNLENLIDLLQAPYSLRLFGNDFIPTPASVIADFIEGPFFGYARQVLTGNFNAPIKIRDGFYASVSNQFTFAFAAPTDTLSYGWWVSNDVEVLLSGRFDVPRACNQFAVVQLQITLQSLASSVPCV